MAFADLTANLNLNIANFSSKLNQASRQMGNFANRMERSYGAAARELTKHNFQLKDTARIVQGIVVAQTFYQAAGAIADATRSLWDFNVALDYMQVTYSALFGNTKVASDFMAVLQEHSVETIFDYQNLADASKKLLAYGIEYENLMFIMEGLTNLGAMSGDSAALDRIALALGQIYTKGKLSAEEMRQLANAYIPITEILQTKFGLTGDDLKRVGDLNLPAADVINAIVDYANENFGSVGDAAMYTITGLQNKIVDSLKVVGAQMLKPVTTAYKSFLAYIANGLETLRHEFEAGGIGGIFEYLVPDQQTQQTIRQFVANVRNLFMALVSVGTVAGQVFGNFASVLVTAFNIVSPLIVGFVNVLSAMLNAMLQSRTGATLLRVALVAAAGAFVVLRVQAMAALVITAVTKAVAGLSKALLILASIITKHPILSLLAGLAITLVGVSSASKGANSAISGLFDTISGAGGGLGSGDVLQKVEQGLTDSAGAADQFNNRLDDATKSANDLSKAIGGSGKAAEDAAKKAGLLSFDEVFKLNDPADDKSGAGGGGTGLLDDLDNLIEGFGGLGDSLIPDIPDFSEFIKGFTDGLFGGLEEGIVDKLKAIGWGVLIGGGLGAVIGGILGGPGGAILGAKIGALAGGIAGLLWEQLGGAISNTAAGAAAGIITVIGKALTKAGAEVGLGALLKNAFGKGGFKGMFSALGGALKTTGLKSILKGGAIGAALGLVVDGIAHLLWKSLEDSFSGANAETAKVGQNIGSAIGAIIGGVLAGPIGIAIGSYVGTFAGGLIGAFWEPIKKFFTELPGKVTRWLETVKVKISNKLTEIKSDWTNKWAEIKNYMSTWWNALVTSLEVWFNTTKTKVITKLTEIKNQWSDTWTEIKTNLSTWWANLPASLEAWFNTTKKTVVTKLTEIKTQWSDTWTEIKTNLNTWWANLPASLDAWFHTTKTKITANLNEIVAKWFTKWDEIKTDLSTWWNALPISLDRWFNTTKTKITTKLTEIKTQWSTKWDEIKTNLSTWWDNLPGSLEAWFNTSKSKVSSKLSEFVLAWTNKWSDIKTNLSTWWSNLPDSLETWFNTTKTKISDKLSEIKTEWSNKWSDIKTNFGTWWSDLERSVESWLKNHVWSPISDFFSISTFWESLKTKLDNIKEKVRGWWDDIKSIFGKTVTFNATATGNGATLAGYATGGIVNREQIARIAEGNKAEAVIPLQNAGAMQPFVDAVGNGLTSYLAPLVANAGGGNSNNLPPLYVGTLIADDRGLRELYKKFEIIQVQENDRRGTPNTPVPV